MNIINEEGPRNSEIKNPSTATQRAEGKINFNFNLIKPSKKRLRTKKSNPKYSNHVMEQTQGRNPNRNRIHSVR
jgi:hypothetical protein